MRALTPVPRLEQTELVNLKKYSLSIWHLALQNALMYFHLYCLSSPQCIVAVEDWPMAQWNTWHRLGPGVDQRQGGVQESHRPQVGILFQDDSNLARYIHNNSNR